MGLGRSGISPIEEGQGAIYVADFYGSTIAQGADGSYQHPVSTMSEAIQLADAALIRRIVLLDCYDNPITLDTDLHTVGYIIEGAAEHMQLAYFNPNNHNIGYCVFRNVAVSGNFDNNGGKVEFHNCEINCAMTDALAYLYDCLLRDVELHGAGTRFFAWNCYADRNENCPIICDAGALIHMVNFKGYMALFSITQDQHEIESSDAIVAVQVSCNGGTIIFSGNTKIVNNGTSTIVDYTGRPRREVAVNITAINGAETSVLDQTADPDLAQEYVLDNLTLKCVDPGANTVNVKLYQLVNGVLTNTKTLGITTATFGTYWDLVTLFGLPAIHGDQIKITVQATAGGPYAVTGSYTMRSF